MPTNPGTIFRFKGNVRFGFKNNKVVEVKRFFVTSKNDGHTHKWRRDRPFTTINGRDPHKHKVMKTIVFTSINGKRPHRHKLLK